MKMYYKPLDITQLSGSPWNTAEKVLGMDQDDKVIMAEPEETVTPEYVDEAIDQAMEAETARTEDTYAKKSEVPDLDDYYTKDEVDGELSPIRDRISINENDIADLQTDKIGQDELDSALEPYATKGWVESKSYVNGAFVDAKVNEAMQSETARTESVYAKKSEIPSLDNYYTKDEVDEAIANVDVSDQLVNYALTSSVTQDIQTAMAAETARTESTYLKEHQSLENYYTKSQVDTLIEDIDVSDQLANYALSSSVTEDINTAIANETARTESTYLKEHQSLDNYYTKSEVDADFASAATAVGRAIDTAVQGLASETYVDNAVAGLASEDYVENAVTAATEGLATQEYVDDAVAGIDFPDDYATTGDVASAVEGLASESYVDDAITSATEGMATQSDLEGLASESYVDDAVNGVVQGIGMLGMVNDVSESNGTVTVQKTTMQEGQLVTGSTSFNIATPGDIQTAMASETARTESTYLKEHQDISGKLDKTDFNTYTGATATVLAGKLDTTAFTQGMASETARTESVYAKKAEIPSLNGYATEAWVEGKGYITEHQDLSAYAKTTAVTEDIQTAIASETARTEETYAKPADIPVAQDGSNVKTYVYDSDASGKNVLSNVSQSINQRGNLTFRSCDIGIIWQRWGSSSSSQYYSLCLGNEYVPGIKTMRDSVLIDNTENALSGFTEQITLTPLAGTQDYITTSNGDKYFQSTNYPRYLIIETRTAFTTSTPTICSATINEVEYYPSNGFMLTPGSQIYNYGTYQFDKLKTTSQGGNDGLKLRRSNIPYIIYDKELNNIILSDSLTITRTRNIQEAFDNIPAPDMSDYVSKDELTGDTEQQAIEIGADDTSVTISIYGPNGLETLNLKSTSVSKYKVLDISGWATEGATAFPQYFSYSGISQMGFQDYVMMELDTPYTLTQGEGNHSQITFSGTSPRYIVLNIEDNTVYVSDNPPSVAVEVPGVLDDYAKTTDIPVVPTNVSAFNNDAGYLTQHQSLANYYTKTEIDGMIGDIETLLASI